MTSRLRASRHQSGAAAVEFALISLLLITLLFGILQYGFYFWSRQSAAGAVREAARRSAVGDLTNCGSNTTAGSYKKYVKDEVGGSTGGNTVTAIRTFTPAPTNATGTTQVGDLMTVKVTFQAFDLGLLPLPNGGTVSAQATSRVENFSTTPQTCP